MGNYSNKDALIVQILHEAGAVPFVKTNVPQTMIVSRSTIIRCCVESEFKFVKLEWGETNNLLFGRTLNPFNRSLTPGGSSGGEGALLAMKGSPLGIGTDVGGYGLYY